METKNTFRTTGDEVLLK